MEDDAKGMDTSPHRVVYQLRIHKGKQKILSDNKEFFFAK